jgi:hypothetical protein
MDQMRRGTEHPPSEKHDPSSDELDSIDDLEPEAREAGAVKGGDGSPDIRKAGGTNASTGSAYLTFRVG